MHPVRDDLTCLALLGTSGLEPEWNDRRTSGGHRVVPLPDEARMADLPMVSALFDQLGVRMAPRLDGPAQISAGHQCGVFHVPEAVGSPVIPAQFVAAYAIESVIGFGGTLPTGEVWAVVMYSRVPVASEPAHLFETVALSTSLAVLDLLEAPAFIGHPVRQTPVAVSAIEAGAARVSVLEALLFVNEQVAALESAGTSRALDLANDQVRRRDEVARRLRMAQEVAGLGMWEWAQATGLVTWDEPAAALHGLALADFDGRLHSITGFVHPDDRTRVRAALRAALDGSSVECSYRAQWPDGTVRHLLSRGQTVLDDQTGALRIMGAVLDVSEMREAAAQRAEAMEKMAGLVAVAHALGDAQTVPAVLQIVTERGIQVLGAARVVLTLLRSPEELSSGGDLGEQEQVLLTEVTGDVQTQLLLPVHFPVPMVHTARTGEPLYLPDKAAVIDRFPAAMELYDVAQASASAPLHGSSGRLLGSLSVAWASPHAFNDTDVELLEVFAGQCAQALDRIAAQRAERRAAATTRGLSETLQRSLLTSAPVPRDIDIAVRYEAAGEEAQVGGDWHDAFRDTGGVVTLVIGDVTGHDRAAAAKMGQIRNMMRALSFNASGSTADVLKTLERTLSGLGVQALASTVLMGIDPPAADGTRRLRWSNAGHLPPLLRHVDGTTHLLVTPPDLLLGIDPQTCRAEHAIVAEEGTVVLLYTDGLVERRGEDIDEGIHRLREALAELGHLPLEELCQELLERLASEADDDDVAVLAARLGPRP